MNTSPFKEVLHLLPQKAPKLASQNQQKFINMFFFFLNMHPIEKLSKKLKKSIKIKVGQAVLELLIKNQHFDRFDL